MESLDTYLSCEQIQKRIQTNSLRRSEIPMEHSISLPLPTLRAGQPGYAFFASPALRVPGEPLRQGTPDRWWISDARNGQTLLFAHYQVHPFSTSTTFVTETLPPPSLEIRELQKGLKEVMALITACSHSFFASQTGDPELRRATHDLLSKILPAPLQTRYRTLVPDFFAWLEE